MWTLLLYRQAEGPGACIDRRQIESGQIKIGRSATTCDWAIPDGSGFLSREHCTISAIGLDLFVVDTSTNGVGLNQPGQRIAPQTPVAIRVHDRLLLGDFTIEVATEAQGFAMQAAAAAPQPWETPASFAQPDAWFDRGAAVDPIWGGGGASSAEVHEFLGNAMHDFLAPPTPAAGGPAAGFDPFGGSLGEAFSKPLLAAPLTMDDQAFAIPEDWAAPAAAAHPAAADPFGAPPPPAVPPADDPFAGFVPPPAGADPFAMPRVADPFAPAPAADDPFALPAAPSRASDDPFALPAARHAAPDDPFALPAAPPPAAEAADPFAGFGNAPAPPATLPPTAMPAAPSPAPAAPAAAGAPDWAAFCEGAGLNPADLRLSPAAMKRLGTLYRQVVLGLSDLIQDRAAFKDEFRVERTQLSFGRNNPLKHLPAVESAKLLLADPLPGFMGAEDAVRTALEDVKKHQLALLAGVQHALRAVFQRLSPAEVDRVMKKAAGEKRGLRLGRGVDPWSVYQTMFEALRTDATSNVNSVMSVAFREGYEAFLKGGAGHG
ncbi:MAG: type VI secretion system-associated FHA domain protein TagH [Sphingomonas fennica]